MEPSTRLDAPSSPDVMVSSTDQLPISTFGIDPFSWILQMLAGNDSTGGFFDSASGVFDFLSTLWSVWVFFAFLLCLIMLLIYIYASIRRWQYFMMMDAWVQEQQELYDAQFRGLNKRNRMDDILEHLDSDNPNDWKLAIIEADIILDDILKQRGYAGNSLGERLKSITPQQLGSLNEAWEAHKVRNLIAHEGADFVLTQRKAEETISRYRRVFAEFGIL